MWLSKLWILVAFVALVNGEKKEDDDASTAFIEAAKSLFADKDTMNNLQGMASAFIQSDTGKQVGDMFTGGGGSSNVEALSQIVSGVGRLFSDNSNRDGPGLSILGTVLDALTSTPAPKKQVNHHQPRGEVEPNEEGGIDFESVMNIGSMLLGKQANSNILMGVMPMILESLSGGTSENEVDSNGKHDHSGHNWYMPPVLEHIHVMWDHFSNSEFAQALWKNSGLNKIVAQMTDPRGNIQYEKILDSFEDPTLRRRWITSLTNFVAEWMSYISDPIMQQRYLTTIQFVGNSFLKSQGYPKSVMFDSTKPTESLSRLANAVAQRHLNMKIDSSQYIKPAVAYIQELIALASEKGFIMSRVNARQLSSRLSRMINNDIAAPLLKAYRAYKWAVKSPECSSQILCTINERNDTNDDILSQFRRGLLKVASFPAAWAASNKIGTNFWILYGAIMEHEGCIRKYPVNCTDFHEEEMRATTENIHNEL